MSDITIRIPCGTRACRERWARVYGREPAELQVDLIGLTSCTPWRGLDVPETAEPPEVRLRAAVQAFDRWVAVDLAREVEALHTFYAHGILKLNMLSLGKCSPLWTDAGRSSAGCADF